MTIPTRTKGAWLIAHSLKLQKVDAQGQFTCIESAGKFGRTLSILSATDEQSISKRKLTTLAKANSINPDLELPVLLEKMEERHLISRSKNGEVAILGLTHGTILEKTAEIFDDLSPEPEELAVVDIAERVSQEPILAREMREYVSDQYRLTKKRTQETLAQAEDIGFVDAEEINLASKDKLYFNGNIFRSNDAKKTYSVLQSLSSSEQHKVNEFSQIVATRGYATVDEAKKLLGSSLFSKLQSIALFDVNRVANENEEVLYVTRPASFSKYGNPWEEDTLDYAKALVSSLAYGMTRSSASRGRIFKLHLLLEKLIRGEWLNENTAAGQDYRYLELKRVVETREGIKAGCYNLRLLKKEVGIVALEVLTQGSGSSESLLERLPGSPVITYSGPEENRGKVRKKKIVAPSDGKFIDMLQSLRTGRIF
ncbi:MAG: hypothetical protein AB1500_08535 [Bacillota bacterium]